MRRLLGASGKCIWALNRDTLETAPSAQDIVLSKGNACDSQSHFAMLRMAAWRKAWIFDDTMESWTLLLLEPVLTLSALSIV